MTASLISPRAADAPPPMTAAPGGAKTPGGQPVRDAQETLATGADHRSSQQRIDAQCTPAAAVQAGQDRAASGRSSPNSDTLFDPALALAADVLDDLEHVRMANANRLAILTRSETDSDGEERGFGLDESHPDVARLAAMVQTLEKVEHDATLNLQRAMRKHPLGPWVKRTVGVGEKQAARLLAAIGDPYINSAKGQPRTVSALWAYSGLHVLPASSQARHDAQERVAAGGDQDRSDPGQPCTDAQTAGAGVAAQRRKGQKANWSSNAKMRAYLIATSCIKQARSPYRDVYDKRRAHTAATHPEWTAGHSHNDALRVASKAILRDLWREAKAIHEVSEVPT